MKECSPSIINIKSDPTDEVSTHEIASTYYNGFIFKTYSRRYYVLVVIAILTSFIFLLIYIKADIDYRELNKFRGNKLPALTSQNQSQTDTRQDIALERLDVKQSALYDRIDKLDNKVISAHDDILSIKGDIRIVSGKLETLGNLALLIFGTLFTLLLERGASYLSDMRKKNN